VGRRGAGARGPGGRVGAGARRARASRRDARPSSRARACAGRSPTGPVPCAVERDGPACGARHPGGAARSARAGLPLRAPAARRVRAARRDGRRSGARRAAAAVGRWDDPRRVRPGGVPGPAGRAGAAATSISFSTTACSGRAPRGGRRSCRARRQLTTRPATPWTRRMPPPRWTPRGLERVVTAGPRS
jgi:hypothetical protein